jgi:hypothetical protein
VDTTHCGHDTHCGVFSSSTIPPHIDGQNSVARVVDTGYDHSDTDTEDDEMPGLDPHTADKAGKADKADKADGGDEEQGTGGGASVVIDLIGDQIRGDLSAVIGRRPVNKKRSSNGANGTEGDGGGGGESKRDARDLSRDGADKGDKGVEGEEFCMGCGMAFHSGPHPTRCKLCDYDIEHGWAGSGPGSGPGSGTMDQMYVTYVKSKESGKDGEDGGDGGDGGAMGGDTTVLSTSGLITNIGYMYPSSFLSTSGLSSDTPSCVSTGSDAVCDAAPAMLGGAAGAAEAAGGAGAAGEGKEGGGGKRGLGGPLCDAMLNSTRTKALPFKYDGAASSLKV